MQHQNYIAVLDTFTGIFERLPNDKQKEIEDRILRILPALGDHVLTTELDAALTALITRLRQAQRGATAQAVQSARDTLAQSIGKLNSRATRVSEVPPAGSAIPRDACAIWLGACLSRR
jgi:hypothetical protein